MKHKTAVQALTGYPVTDLSGIVGKRLTYRSLGARQ